MKKLTMKWLGIGEIQESVKKLGIKAYYHEDWFIKLHQSIDTIRQEINGIIETLQNSDNNGYVETLEKTMIRLAENLADRRQEIDTVIETLQNLDNHEVIRDLHLRILELEKTKIK